VVAAWIKPLAAQLSGAEAFRGCELRRAARSDEERLFALHREAMKDYVAQTWGWDEAWQRTFFAQTYAPSRHALIVRSGARIPETAALVGRICLTRHWRRVFLRDIELVAGERNRGLGTAIVAAILELARERRQAVDLLVLKCNPAQRLYVRLGFAVIADDGARLTMRAT
jgi:ribosomal protein S18 acetylase RimI-like enzyme